MNKPAVSPFTLGLLGILILALTLRLIHLSGSFWLDEAAQALESARPLAEQLNIAADFQPPLFHLVIHLWQFASQSEMWLRLPSLVAGLCTILLTALIGKKLFSGNVGLTAGILLATSQLHLFYSQELRPYSLAALWGMLFLAAYYRVIHHQRFGLGLFILTGIAGIYTMYVFPVLIVAALAVTLMWHRSNLKQIAIGIGCIAAGFLPWVPKFIEQLHVGTSLVASYGNWSELVSPPVWKMLPLVAVKFLIGRMNVDVALGDITIIGSLLILCLFLLNRAWPKKHAKEMLAWLIVPIAAAFVVSLVIPVLDAKRVLFSLPIMYLVLSAGIGRGYRSALALLVLLSVNMIGVSRYVTDPSTQREPWRQAVRDIELASDPGDKVVFTFPGPFAPWTWYQTQQMGTVAIPNPPQQLTDPTVLEPDLAGTASLFVFDYLQEVADPDQVLLTSLKALGFTETGFVQYEGIGKVRLLERLRPIARLP